MQLTSQEQVIGFWKYDKMTKIIIYAGLSLPFSEAKEILDTTEDIEVVYKRPIQRGDLGEALKEHPDIIGIIDGVFHQNSAVGHKEILNVMKKGIKAQKSKKECWLYDKNKED